ncbi:MAG: methionine--tRNA ligase [Candidatus Omnitrophica bacterium]|nr:methionine--tRNA ligase [Candidatus Omnitrophota bacterium]
MADKFYITTPLYYVNASPHIGHSYTCIAADTLARHMRHVIGEKNVWFLTGTDEHGQKIQKAADAQGLSPLVFADNTVGQFKKLWEVLNISYNDFIRTTEDRHKRVVARVLDILYKKGDIYQDTYQGWYCTPCETFWIESQLSEGKCPDCKRPVEKISETNYFFKLSKYQDWLVEHIKNNPDFIKPASRYEEVSRFLELNKLSDLCISRPRERLGWGIPLPFSPEHVTYVWFDALINYISAVGDFNDEGKYISRWWPADIQLMGKDILRQHAVYWPIMLRALDIAPPKLIFAHGWWMMGESKMSKSLGNVVSPIEMAHKYGTDPYRYFLLRDVPFGLDGNFSEESIIKRYNSDLANDLGNLVFRTLTMIEKYFSGNVPVMQDQHLSAQGKLIKEKLLNIEQMVISSLNVCGFSQALEEVWSLINMANKYVEDTKPWNLAKENKTEELKTFIALLAKVIRQVGKTSACFMPKTAEAIFGQIGEATINKSGPLFPRIDTK